MEGLTTRQMKVRFDIEAFEGVSLSDSHADLRQIVYNHVLKLDLNTLQWDLVDNYGDIPGVRMGSFVPQS